MFKDGTVVGGLGAELSPGTWGATPAVPLQTCEPCAQATVAEETGLGRRPFEGRTLHRALPDTGLAVTAPQMQEMS